MKLEAFHFTIICNHSINLFFILLRRLDWEQNCWLFIVGLWNVVRNMTNGTSGKYPWKLKKKLLNLPIVNWAEKLSIYYCQFGKIQKEHRRNIKDKKEEVVSYGKNINLMSNFDGWYKWQNIQFQYNSTLQTLKFLLRIGVNHEYWPDYLGPFPIFHSEKPERGPRVIYSPVAKLLQDQQA